MTAFALAILALLATTASPAPSHCEFHEVNGQWAGSCGPLFDETPAFTIAPAQAIVSGTWRKDASPTIVWAGKLKTSEDPGSAIEIEIYAGGTGVLRTEDGWFAVSGFAQTGHALHFQLDASREIPPSELDREIVKRADGILSSEAVWNRADNRKCPADANTWSLYCAMEKATIEVAGAFHHRRPALQTVREIVDERSVGRKYDHRLMDYNNDPSTRLADVRSLFAEALRRMGR